LRRDSTKRQFCNDDWLGSRNPEFARALIELYRPEEFNAYPAPKFKSIGPSEAEEIQKETAQVIPPSEHPEQSNLFAT
jgi:hypothetical protein